MPILSIILAITVWTRGAGDYTDFNEVPQLGLTSVALDSLPAVEKELMDVQYGHVANYRGVPLASVIAAAPPVGRVDTVLLHFENDMVIPVSLDVGTLVPVSELFIATEMVYDGKWTKRFPSIAKADSLYRDPLPLRFGGNKLVTAQRTFPWRHVASLKGIEYVVRTAYENQFRAAKTSTNDDGRRVFLDRCQFCHGVRGVGPSHGWDFLKPLPIADKRTDRSLAYHVKYKKLDAVERGLMMPPQKDFTEAEAGALRRWLIDLTPTGPRPYRP